MAKKTTEDIARDLSPSEEPAAEEGGRMPEDKSQSGNEPVEAEKYSYGEEDDRGFDIETTRDRSQAMAEEAVEQAKGSGHNDGLGEVDTGEYSD